MRLLNIYTLQLEEFPESNTPSYLILSHRWQGKEVSYKDWVKGNCKETPGYKKIVGFCEFAKSLKDFAHFRVAAGRRDSISDRCLMTFDGTQYRPATRAGGRDLMLFSKAGIQWVWVDTCKR